MLDLHGILQQAFDLIVDEEVTSEAVCNRRYRRLTCLASSPAPPARSAVISASRAPSR